MKNSALALLLAAGPLTLFPGSAFAGPLTESKAPVGEAASPARIAPITSAPLGAGLGGLTAPGVQGPARLDLPPAAASAPRAIGAAAKAAPVAAVPASETSALPSALAAQPAVSAAGARIEAGSSMTGSPAAAAAGSSSHHGSSAASARAALDVLGRREAAGALDAAALDAAFSGASRRAGDPLSGQSAAVAASLRDAFGSRKAGPDKGPGDSDSARLKKSSRSDDEEGGAAVVSADPLSRSKLILRLQDLAKNDPAQALVEAGGILRDPAERRWDVRVSAMRALANADPAAVATLLLERLPALGSWSLKREAIQMLSARLSSLDEAGRASALSAFQQNAQDENPSVMHAARAALEAAGVDPGPEPAPKPEVVRKTNPIKRWAKAGWQAIKPAVGWAVVGLVGLWIGAIATFGVLSLIFPGPVVDGQQTSSHYGTIASELFSGMFIVVMGGIVAVALMWGALWVKKKLSNAAVSNVERPDVTFSDVAGIDESMVELQEVMNFLKDPEQYKRLGGRPPRGVLLVGPPGTGKTLLAKALAGETNASFISANGSQFIEMYVGVGAKRVREMFAKARAHAPAILFIDEIDSIAGKRMDNQESGGAQEHLQTINALLAEMDGFHNGDNVIVIGATNRVDALDPAARRPGRFDRTVHVDLPDTLGRESILQVHAEKVRLGNDVDLKQIASPNRTGGMSGAYLANIVNEAASMAGRRGAGEISMKDMIEAADRESMGQARATVMSPAEKRLTAYHEAGHALVQIALGGKVDKATIIPRGQSGGHVRTSEEEDVHMHSLPDLKRRMAMAMGGIVAERRLLDGAHTSGPSSDLENATNIAETMVAQLGMGQRTGFAARRGHRVQFSQRQLRNMELDVDDLLNEARQTAERVLTERRDDWEKLAQALLSEETLSGEQIEALLKASAPEPAAQR